jgi:hypothetical protein
LEEGVVQHVAHELIPTDDQFPAQDLGVKFHGFFHVLDRDPEVLHPLQVTA